MNKNYFVVNPYNNDDLTKIINFEKDIDKVFVSKSLEETKTSMTEEQYNNLKKTNNTITIDFCLKENNQVKDMCHIVGEKDIKTCYVSLAPIKGKRKKLIEQVTDYIFNTLNMEQLFITIKKEDSTIIKTLLEEDFESLGEENNQLLFLKDKEEQKEKGRRIS